MLRPDRDFFQTPRSLRVAMISALAAAYCVQGDAVLARKYLGRALRMADHIDDEVTRSRVYHQASYIALQYGEFERAKDFATRAWILAEKLGAQEVAGGALSVLYNVAADVDEDCRLAAEYLRRMAECGAKTGSIGKQQYALIAAYEMETERGDTSAIASVENDLREFDVEYSAQYANEGLVPSQALQLAWHGDFARAYQLVRPSAAQQMDSERRALRWSEIAIYAAGAGNAR
jgi:ATP/maltotriose-dependent transcriptional regulator MalT